MGWIFRQSFQVIPGLRINLSKSGLSASIGGSPLTLNVGPRGVTGTASIPGTGISYRHHFETPADGRSSEPSSLSLFPSDPGFTSPSNFVPTNTAPIEVIHSASTELLTSATFKDLKKLIQTAFEEHEDISRQLDTARDDKITAVGRLESWENGFLLKRLFKKAFAKRKEAAETETAKVNELEEQLRLTTIAANIEVEKEQADLYYRLRDEFDALRESAAIWDVKTRQATDKFHERTTANSRIDRERVRFALDSCDLIQWDERVPHLKNAKGGDFYLYPGFILYRAAREAFSVIEYHDVKGQAIPISFQEEDGVPSDSKVIGHTWAKANKDGSRDKRFVNNYQIPIVQYGSVTLKSQNGLWEEFHFSNPDRMARFLAALNAFTSSFDAIAG